MRHPSMRARNVCALVALVTLACSGRGRVASSVSGDDLDATADAPSDESRIDAAEGLPLPVDPTGECTLSMTFPRGAFVLAPEDMDAFVPMPSSDAVMYVIEEGAPLASSIIDAAAARLTLQAWPDGPPIDVTKQIDRPDGVDRRTRITVRPKSALPLGWFVFRIADPPAELTRFPPLSVHPYGARGLETRFHTGTYPMLAWVRVCNRGGGSMIFRLEHSQNVSWTASLSAIFSLTQTGGSPSCSVVDARTPGSKEHLELRCSALSDSAPITLTTKSGLASLDGVTVVPSSYTFTLATLPRLGNAMVFQTNPP